ncbi:MarR family winged helix-turn-helix transcriptional regulator [Levilactobacillus yiduensis]|uniref:MarR family winged helix-turn-helix transcriptional regulator n=1 Tax=Levilactobacillus yiduensis TaxID=2953880 RepID=UPI001AD7E81A|nr:MarR family winged helix-turn-helix transcriptional regulator [Levilactobacillus yiduensis]
MKNTAASELNHLMREILVAEQQVYDRRARQVGVTLPQARTLGFIAQHPGVNQREIADHFHRRGASVSNLLKILERDGLIVKNASHGTQNRSNRITLTAAGQAKVVALTTIFTDVEDQLTTQLSPADSQQLIALLRRVQLPRD